MAEPIHDQVEKCLKSRCKAELVLKNFQKDLVDAVDNSERQFVLSD